MSRKDYELIARVLKNARAMNETRPLETWGEIVIQLSRELAADNPRFNVDAFVDACIGGDK